jgi:predicted nuclease of predicted toxin-antitoxin system
MRILLDECIPLRLVSSPVFAGHQVDHVTRSGFSQFSNGRLHREAQGQYDLLVTSDRHFRTRPGLQPVESMGVICLRVVPNVFETIAPALEALSEQVALEELVGKLTVVWRDRWEIR